MNLFTLTGKIALQGASETKQDLREVQRQTDTSANAMMTSLKRLGGVIASVFAVDKIVTFGQKVVQASADVQAEAAQFEAAFKDMVGGTYDLLDASNAMFNRVAKNTGVLASRLKVTGTKAFSQFRGAGNEANKSLELTEKFLNMASDAAAYYDISLEDAEYRMRSFVRGNVEAGDAIGLFTSESQRNAKAMDLYGKKYIKLNEAQKQFVMLDIAQTIYDQSGATGQAAREADGYVNVLGNLKETWRQFLAVVGEPVLARTIPIMQNVTEKLVEIGQKAQGVKGWMEEHEEAVQKLKDAFYLATAGVIAFTLALGLVKGISGIIDVVTHLGTSLRAVGGILTENKFMILAGVLATLAIYFTKLWNENEEFRSGLVSSVESIKKQVLPVLESVTTALKPIADFLGKTWDTVFNFFIEEGKEIWDSFKKFTETGDLSALWKGAKKVIEIGLSFLVYKESLSGVTAALTSHLGLSAGSGKFAALGLALIGLKFMEAMESKDWANLVTAIAVGLGVGVLTKDPKTGMLAATIVLNFKLGDVVKDLSHNVSKNMAEKMRRQFGSEDMSGDTFFEKLPDNLSASSTLKTMIRTNGELMADYLAMGYGMGLEEVNNLTEEQANEIVENVKKILGIHSPSTVFMEIGQYIAEGLGIGVEDGEDWNSLAGRILTELGNRLMDTELVQGIGRVLGFDFGESFQEGAEDGEDADGEGGSSSGGKGKKPWKERYADAKKAMNEFFTGAKEKVSKVMGYTDAYIAPFMQSCFDLAYSEAQAEIKLESDKLAEIRRLNEEEREAEKTEGDEAKRKLEEDFVAGRLSYEQYIQAKNNIDRKQDANEEKRKKKEEEAEAALHKKKDDLARKQFIANKVNTIAGILVQAAMATMTAFAQLGPIAGAIAAGLIATTAGIQTGIVASQEYVPAMETGGITKKAMLALIGENGQEAVVPLEKNLEWVSRLSQLILPTFEQGVAAALAAQSVGLGYAATSTSDGTLVAILERLDAIADREPVIMLDTGVLVSQISPKIDRELGQIARRRNY